MTANTAKAKTLITLISLLTLGATSVGAMACAPYPQADNQPLPNEQPEPRPQLEPADEQLTPEASDRILQTVASEVGRPASNLRIVAAEAATWDGCMGIYVPDQACTMIAIFGQRLVVTDGDQSWVYHTSQDGQQVVQNPTASGSRNGLIPDFIPPVPEPGADPEDYIFRSLESGSLSGSQREIVLLADGRLLHRDNGTVVSEQRVAPAQLDAFQRVLEDQRFPNLNRMRYVTDAAFADYPTVKLSTMYYQAEYIDLAVDDMPTAVQSVIQAWDDLTRQAE